MLLIFRQMLTYESQYFSDDLFFPFFIEFKIFYEISWSDSTESNYWHQYFGIYKKVIWTNSQNA